MGPHPLLVEVLARQFQRGLEEKARRYHPVAEAPRRSFAARIVRSASLRRRAPAPTPAIRVPAGC